MKVGATKIQPDGSDKKEIRKRGLMIIYNYSSVKLNKNVSCLYWHAV